MKALDSEIDAVFSNYAWDLEALPRLDTETDERVLAQSLKAQANIKLVSIIQRSLAPLPSASPSFPPKLPGMSFGSTYHPVEL
jgi:hypothetical protein